jgi:hypothetical protein
MKAAFHKYHFYMSETQNILKEQLQALYHDESKHAGYQSLPDFVREALGYNEVINHEWRGDKVRLDYISKELPWTDCSLVGDVGANTGFFTFSLARTFPAAEFVAYEANQKHALFMRLVIDYFGLKNVKVEEKLMSFDRLDILPRHDVLLLFNVLHHAGHDFDANLVKHVTDLEAYCIDYLNKIRDKSSQLIFQMGSNWGGNKALPIIPLKEDARKVCYMAGLLTKAGWTIRKAALPQRNADRNIFYQNFPEELTYDLNQNPDLASIPKLGQFLEKLNLDQFIGEFYRRPIFICDNRRGN